MKLVRGIDEYVGRSGDGDEDLDPPTEPPQG